MDYTHQKRIEQRIAISLLLATYITSALFFNTEHQTVLTVDCTTYFMMLNQFNNPINISKGNTLSL